jgi:protein-S-isoprenylcysteine O-methyltransferase Ste14
MNRIRAVAGSALFLLLAPGTVAVLIPYLITGWELREPILGLPGERMVASALLATGLVLLVEAFGRFALVGRGTPAPVAETERLVVSGSYEHVRNPMYLAVVAVILGQALLFGSWLLVGYALLAWIIVHLFVVFYEERRLARRFGEEYDAYRASVRRWVPRLKPWRPSRSATTQREVGGDER